MPLFAISCIIIRWLHRTRALRLALLIYAALFLAFFSTPRLGQELVYDTIDNTKRASL
jgi:hypothetical protein